MQGSSELVQQLLEHALVDLFHFTAFPVLLGRGKRLFDERALPSALELVESKVSTTGVLIASYVPDGEVKTGRFAWRRAHAGSTAAMA